MLMVILGAGATYDSSPYFPATKGTTAERPPLADELFLNRATFQMGKDKFPQFRPMIPQLIHRGGATVEQVLRRQLERAADYPPLHVQLMAIRYYLQWIMLDSVSLWQSSFAHGATNQLALVHRIRQAHKSHDPVCLVTFNYDTLLESALEREFRAITDYVSDPTFKLIKLHGSVNWGHRVMAPALSYLPLDNAERAAREVIAHATQLNLAPHFEITSGMPPAAEPGIVRVPAIALPVEQKSDFECPPAQLDLLCGLLPRVTRILTVGWRATEDHL